MKRIDKTVCPLSPIPKAIQVFWFRVGDVNLHNGVDIFLRFSAIKQNNTNRSQDNFVEGMNLCVKVCSVAIVCYIAGEGCSSGQNFVLEVSFHHSRDRVWRGSAEDEFRRGVAVIRRHGTLNDPRSLPFLSHGRIIYQRISGLFPWLSPGFFRRVVRARLRIMACGRGRRCCQRLGGWRSIGRGRRR